MKFIVDAHLPFGIVKWLVNEGFDAIHTTQLVDKNLTSDAVIIKISVDQQRVVISKDHDFFEYYVLYEQPYKLLLLTVGNITNKDLMALFQKHFAQIKAELEINHVLEFNRESIIVKF